jgi:hypothetical protein
MGLQVSCSWAACILTPIPSSWLKRLFSVQKKKKKKTHDGAFGLQKQSFFFLRVSKWIFIKLLSTSILFYFSQEEKLKWGEFFLPVFNKFPFIFLCVFKNMFILKNIFSFFYNFNMLILKNKKDFNIFLRKKYFTHNTKYELLVWNDKSI